jgi:hypothetical protein
MTYQVDKKSLATHACAGKTDPPSSSQILSQTAAEEKVATSSIALLLFEQFLCSRRAPFLRPSRRSDNGAARR